MSGFGGDRPYTDPIYREDRELNAAVCARQLASADEAAEKIRDARMAATARTTISHGDGCPCLGCIFQRVDGPPGVRLTADDVLWVIERTHSGYTEPVVRPTYPTFGDGIDLRCVNDAWEVVYPWQGQTLARGTLRKVLTEAKRLGLIGREP